MKKLVLILMLAISAPVLAVVNLGDNVVNTVAEVDAKLDTKMTTTSLATVATTGSYNDLSDTPAISLAGRTGNYEYLSNRPLIPPMQQRSDWNTTDANDITYIQNKPLLAKWDGSATGTYYIKFDKSTGASLVGTINIGNANGAATLKFRLKQNVNVWFVDSNGSPGITVDWGNMSGDANPGYIRITSSTYAMRSIEVIGNIIIPEVTISTTAPSSQPTWNALTLAPTAPTAAAGTKTTQVATTAFVAANAPQQYVYTRAGDDWIRVAYVRYDTSNGGRGNQTTMVAGVNGFGGAGMMMIVNASGRYPGSSNIKLLAGTMEVGTNAFYLVEGTTLSVYVSRSTYGAESTVTIMGNSVENQAFVIDRLTAKPTGAVDMTIQ